MGLFSTGAGAATRAATDAVAARQGRASNLTTLVNNTFADPRRENQTLGFMDALRTQLGDETTRGFNDASRQRKFATARTGLTGGRVDVDRQSRGLEELFKRRIGDESQVQDAGNSLRDQDEAQRAALIDQAYGVADTGQSAIRGNAGRMSRNASSLEALWPSLFASTGADISGAYSNRANLQAMLAGMGGGTAPNRSSLYAWNTPSFAGGQS